MRRLLFIVGLAALAGCPAHADERTYGNAYYDTGYYYGGQSGPYYAAPGDFDYTVDQRYAESGTYYYPAGWPYYSSGYYYGGPYRRPDFHHDHDVDGHHDNDHGDHGDHHAGGGDNDHESSTPNPGFVTRPDGSPAAPHGPAGASPSIGSHSSGGGGSSNGSSRGSPHGR